MARCSPAPGRSSSQIAMPITSDTTPATTNQPTARAPMRPTAEPVPMWAIPATSVASTSGAMIILISRRNTPVISENPSAQTLACAAGRSALTSAPAARPSTIPARM